MIRADDPRCALDIPRDVVVKLELGGLAAVEIVLTPHGMATLLQRLRAMHEALGTGSAGPDANTAFVEIYGVRFRAREQTGH